jgi:hypothetical protein
MNGAFKIKNAPNFVANHWIFVIGTERNFEEARKLSLFQAIHVIEQLVLELLTRKPSVIRNSKYLENSDLGGFSLCLMSLDTLAIAGEC